MLKKYVCVHLPVAPISYSFSKIGHYHRYDSEKLQRKQEKYFIAQLKSLLKDEVLDRQFKFISSSYTFPLFPDELQEKIFRQIDWSFGSTDLRNSQLKIRVGDEVENTGEWYYFNIQTGGLVKLADNIWTLTPNELQAEVCRILSYLKSLHSEDTNFHQQLKWFLNAEHILWMDKDTEKYLFASPFNSPYDAYINLMNMLSDFKLRYRLNF